MQGARPGGQKVRERVLTILLGSSVAIALALLAGDLASWVPPSRNPVLAHYYPDYLMEDINNLRSGQVIVGDCRTWRVSLLPSVILLVKGKRRRLRSKRR
jgi:hypothetical protein